jgi:hypothetical protein
VAPASTSPSVCPSRQALMARARRSSVHVGRPPPTARHGTARHGAPRCQPCQCTPTNYSISGRALNIASGNGVTSGATASCCTLCDLLARTASTGHRAPNHDPGWTTLIATHARMHVRARGCLLGKKNCSYRHYIVDRLNHSVCPFAALPLSASVTL